ncbi:MAG: trpC [Firmicutes bacterium]|nr:trpC [Bacillota bacterium]
MILDTIAQATVIRVAKAKERISQKDLIQRIYGTDGLNRFHNRTPFAFENSLRKISDLQNGPLSMAFICEVKKASPSKGLITETFPYLSIAKEYEEAGADAISVLTEPDYFLGADHYLTEISKEVSVPVLRKDFVLDEYQIYEAKQIGADAILLICSLLDTQTIRRYLNLCAEMGLSALVEAHSEEELHSALSAGARIIGVNNRNLRTFEVDINLSLNLRKMVPEEIIFVAESGIQCRDDIIALSEARVDAVLIGETLMRSRDKKDALEVLRGYSH